MTPLLKVENLITKFHQHKGSVTVVDGIHFSVYSGETLGIVGESGSGKSVTSLSIMRLLSKNAEVTGKINFNGMDVNQLSEKEMKRLRGNTISMIFQEPMTSLNPLHTIGKQLSEPLMNHMKMSKKEALLRSIELLKEVGIPRAEDIISEFPHQLSGGMRQRVMIAMAMACSPQLIIADEPTTALDVTIQAQILELMKKLKQTNKTAMILITHDLGVVAEMCDRVAVMYAGQVVEEADVKTLFKSPKHPYTIGLMNSMPDLVSDKQRLDSIPGTVPSITNMPHGCRFAPRCAHAMEICKQKQPDLLSISESHNSRCWLHVEEGNYDTALIRN